MQLLGQHQAHTVVAFGQKGAKSAADLLRDVATVARALPEERAGKECLLCFRSDRYEFAVALFAAWQVGLRAVLPPNLQVETISRLLDSQERVALLHDTQVTGHLRVSDLLGGTAASPLTELPRPSGIVASVLTSGSTGESQVWAKSLEQLVGELGAWHGLLASDAPPRVVATVQPGHLYGLLFSVLYPLLTGGAFYRQIPFAPEAIAEAILENGADTLVTVPVHLRATQAIGAGSLATLVRVLSSTAPLHEADERQFRERHGVGVTEIFGSTETGGVAYRQRERHPFWTPLPEVLVSRSDAGRLVVDSPFSSVGLPRPYESADRIELHADGSFSTLGRDDSVVKIGGKRVSFLEQEAWLLQQPAVSDAAILDVPDPVRGTRLLALIESDEPETSTLRLRMASHFGASVIPKRFVVMHALPRGPNGKLSRKNALSLFKVGLDGRALPESVAIIGDEEAPVDQPDTIRTRVVVPADFVWFQGHFEGYPVMAGVVQLLSVAMPLLRRRWPELGEIRTMEGLKFTGRIRPLDELVFSATVSEGQLRGQFSIQKEGQVLTAGRLTFFDRAATDPIALASGTTDAEATGEEPA